MSQKKLGTFLENEFLEQYMEQSKSIVGKFDIDKWGFVILDGFSTNFGRRYVWSVVKAVF